MKTLPDRHGKLIAYEVLGRGRPLVCDTGFVSHLDRQWDYPPYRRFFEALARGHRVIRFDLPGIGLGDPTGNVVEFDDDVAVLEDLIDGLKLESVDLFGASQAAAVMVATRGAIPSASASSSCTAATRVAPTCRARSSRRAWFSWYVRTGASRRRRSRTCSSPAGTRRRGGSLP
jgi:pimeloyl-ACP methyl ester carboxylesterase